MLKRISSILANCCLVASEESCRNQHSRESQIWRAKRAKALTNFLSSRIRATSNANFSFDKIGSTAPVSSTFASEKKALNSLSIRLFWFVFSNETVKSEFGVNTKKKGCFIPKPNKSELIIEGVSKPDARVIPGSGVFI